MEADCQPKKRSHEAPTPKACLEGRSRRQCDEQTEAELPSPVAVPSAALVGHRGSWRRTISKEGAHTRLLHPGMHLGSLVLLWQNAEIHRGANACPTALMQGSCMQGSHEEESVVALNMFPQKQIAQFRTPAHVPRGSAVALAEGALL